MNPTRDPIDRHLKKLAPATASAEFTERVMEAIEEAAAERPHVGWVSPSWAALAAAAAAIAIGIFLVRANSTEHSLQGTRSTQLAEMRRQTALLKQELGDLRTRAADSAPVIYLGSVDDVDYVWDLSPLFERQTPRAVPASNRTTPTLQTTRELP